MHFAEISISVRSLVEYVFSSGSLMPGFSSGAAMAEGTRIHQHIQKQYKEGDRKEVYLKTELVHEGLKFIIDGRCDGLLTGEDGTVTVEEIKSTGELLEPDFAGKEVHWAQALMYAHILCLDLELTAIRVKLTYVRRGGEEQQSLYRQMTSVELEAFASDTVARYAPYAELLVRHQEQRDASIRALAFPFPDYRNGQRHFAAAVYKSVSEKVNLFAQAPTGIGKTMSTLFPALKALGRGRRQACSI